MRGSRIMTIGALVVCAAGATLIGAGQQGGVAPQGLGQAPGGLPLTPTIREKGSSVTPAFEGWYYEKDGSVRVMVGYFNRNTKQEFDIPPGPNNHVDPGGPDQGQPTHFDPGRGWGVFTIGVPKDFTGKNLTWTIVTNGYTNTITLHTHPDYIVEPYMDPASQNTPPKFKFDPNGKTFTGPPNGIAATYTGTVGVPVPITVWVTDEGPKLNVPERTGGRGRGRGAAGRGGDAAAAGGNAAAAGGAAGRGPAAVGAAGGGRAAAAPAEFQPPPPLAISWTKFRGPGEVKFDKVKPSIDKADGKSVENVTFGAPGDYILRIEGNDSTGQGGGGFQCCWSNAHVAVTIK
jgi:hypothetical protein